MFRLTVPVPWEVVRGGLNGGGGRMCRFWPLSEPMGRWMREEWMKGLIGCECSTTLQPNLLRPYHPLTSNMCQGVCIKQGGNLCPQSFSLSRYLHRVFVKSARHFAEDSVRVLDNRKNNILVGRNLCFWEHWCWNFRGIPMWEIEKTRCYKMMSENLVNFITYYST